MEELELSRKVHSRYTHWCHWREPALLFVDVAIGSALGTAKNRVRGLVVGLRQREEPAAGLYCDKDARTLGAAKHK